MGMRIGGLATGMDIDGIVKDLMAAERIPLDKLEQDKTRIEWQRDAFRDVNSKLLELDRMMLDMKMGSTYNTKSATSSNQAVTATANSGASIGSYNIAVTQLATSAINATNGTLSEFMGLENGKVNPFSSLSEQAPDLLGGDFPKTIAFKTYHNGEQVHTIDVTEEDSLNSILTKITNHKEAGVRAFYDVQSDRVIMERTGAGDFNSAGAEIEFLADENGFNFFSDVFGLNSANETGGTDAKFEYNGIELTSKTNSTTLNGISFTFNDLTDRANINVNNDTDAAFDNIKSFVDKYNEMIDKVNGKVTEEHHRDYPPLTSEQMEEMSDREIELWEEKARSGLLRRDPILTNALSQMRQSWSSRITNDGAYSHLSQIGISTTANYMDDRIEVFKRRLQQVEDRYWKQFSAMESAIQRMNEQSNYLFSQFNQQM